MSVVCFMKRLIRFESRVYEITQWLKWCQDQCDVIFLPFTEKHRARRRAEQGDLLAVVYCIHEIPTNVRPRVCLFWFLYAYDGQYVCRPGCVDIFFEFIDRAAAKAIFLRGTGRDVKFTVRLIVDELVIDAFSENHKKSWFMNPIREFMLDLALQQQSQSV